MTARVVLAAAAAAAAAGLVAGACSHGSAQDGARPTDPGTAADPAATGPPGPTDAARHPGAGSRCRAELAELDRRDEAGTVDWAAIEGPEDEPTEEELASVMIDGEPFAGDVLVGGERPTFPDFPDRLDIASLSDAELVEAVEICYEIGLLTDEEPVGEEPDDDEAG